MRSGNILTSCHIPAPEREKEVNSDQVYSFLGGGDSTGKEGWIKGFFVHNLLVKDYAEWLGEAVEFTPKLAVLNNSEGKHAIDCAAPECKRAMQDGLHRALITVNSGLESEKADEEALAKEAKAAKEATNKAAKEAAKVCNAP